MFCLDTNVVIGIINGRAPHWERRMIETLAVAPVVLSVITLFELRYGYAKSDRQPKMDALLAEFLSPGIEVLPFEEKDALEAGAIRADLEMKGVPIGAYDVLIAAQARCRSAVLVTANTREFDRVPGLMVTDWAA
jgi:tRNA(fMet)-specific endonuclease VapC